MIWLQGALSFLVWIGYGVFQSRRSEKIRAQVGAIPRSTRGLLGAALFFVGAMVLLGGLFLVLRGGGFTASGMTAWAWLVVTVLGFAFVHAQTLGMAMLVSLVHENVTKARDSASMNRSSGDSTQT